MQYDTYNVRETQLLFARCFAEDKGKRVLEHLRKRTKETVLPPHVSAEQLFYHEGQRALINYIETLIREGNKENVEQPDKS